MMVIHLDEFVIECFTVETDEFCEGYPHSLTPTPGYWIECSRQSGRGSHSHGIREESQEDSSHETSEDDQDHLAGKTDTADTENPEPLDDASDTTTDRAGRRVQLVHQHIQVVPIVGSFIFIALVK